MVNEEKYPMTYKEYEERVVELFLEDYGDDILELMMSRVEEELKEEPNYLHGFYGQDCFRYDHPEIFGDDTKKRFEDNFLRQTPVSQLRLLIG